MKLLHSYVCFQIETNAKMAAMDVVSVRNA